MRKLSIEHGFILGVFLTIMFLSGCSNNPASPENTDTNNPVASVTIGPEGGSINIDQCEITVPPGTFSESIKIAVLKSPNDQAFEENGVSDLYEFKGLPAEFDKPITVKIKYDGQLSESSFIAMGHMQHDQTRNDSLIIYALYAAEDSAGYLQCEIPATNQSSVLKSNVAEFHIDDPARAFFRAVTATKILRTEHFEITYPVTLAASVSDVGTELESALAVLQNELDLYKGTFGDRWHVSLDTHFQGVAGSMIPFLPKFTVSRDLVRQSKFDEIRQEAAYAFLRFGLFTYIPPEVYQDEPGFLWFEIALYSWLEEFLTDDTGFQTPVNYPQNALAPLNGMRAGAGSETHADVIENHGIGMSSLVKYLVNDSRYGKAGILNTFNRIINGNAPAKALINTVDAMVVDWWPQYIQSLVNGDIYPIPLSTLLNNLNGEWNINGATDTLQVFTPTDPNIGLYPDLSAKLFKINLNTPVTDPEKKLRFHYTGIGDNFGMSLAVFGIQNDALFFLGMTHAQDFEIPELNVYYENNMRQFLAVMINNNAVSPYLGTTDLDLTVSIPNPDDNGGNGGSELTYNRCIVGAQVTADFTSNRYGPVENYTELTEFGSRSISGSFSGNTFTGSFENEYGVKETVTVTLNDAHDRVTSMSWAKSDEDEDLDLREYKGFSGVNIPVDPEDNSRFECRGSNTLDCISNFYDNWTWSDQYITLLDHDCDEHSYISVSFSEK